MTAPDLVNLSALIDDAKCFALVRRHRWPEEVMAEQLRSGLIAKTQPVRLDGEVEIDEVYVVAGHKGQPAAVAKGGGSDGGADWQARRAGARWRRISHRS